MRNKRIITIFAALLLIVAIGVTITSDFDKGINFSPGEKKQCGFLETLFGGCGKVLGSCEAVFPEVSVDLSGNYDKVRTTTKQGCLALSKSKERILRDVCSNSQGLGDIQIMWNNEVLDSFPIECSESLAEEGIAITAEGEVGSLISEDLETNYYQEQKILKGENGRDFVLSINELKFGDDVKIRGKLINGRIEVTDYHKKGNVQLSPSNPVTGNKKIIAMKVDFLDSSASCTLGEINDVLFNGDLNNYYLDNSFNGVSLSGDVAGPFNINYNVDHSTSCNYNAWSIAADAEAINSGIDLSQYDHKIYIFPDACRNGGATAMGQLSGNKIWNFGKCTNLNTYAHELGHNFGVRHASSVPSGQVNPNVGGEYGDLSSVMGHHYYGGLAEFNSPHKYETGWVPSNKIIFAGSGVNSYDIAPIETIPSQTALPQIIRIPNSNYYVSYRVKEGADVVLLSDYANKLSIHNFAGGILNSYIYGVIGNGETFTSSEFSVKQLSNDGTKATVQVTMAAQPTCIVNNPTITLTPSSQTKNPEQSASYTLSVVNNDVSCPSSSFSISDIKPSGWSASVSPSSLSLNSGASGNAVLSVSSSTSATGGNYNVGVQVSRTGFSQNKLSTYVVEIPTSDTTPPSIPSNLQGSLVKKGKNYRVELNWQASTDNVGIKEYEIFKDGVKIASTSSTSYNDVLGSSAPSQTINYYVRAVDLSDNFSGNSNSVQISPDSSGGGSQTDGSGGPPPGKGKNK